MTRGPASPAQALRASVRDEVAGDAAALVRAGLARMRERGVPGCVVLGDPAFYGRFGFAPQAGLVYPGPPADHFMALSIGGVTPLGAVRYHPAFSAREVEGPGATQC